MNRSEATKRAFDVLLASLLIVVTFPVLLAATIGTIISLRTQPFFSQTRIGRDGRPFKLVKLRTLPRHVPPYASKYELAHVAVPWFSRMLRMAHLDELPQLYLVVLGKMSLVGPRPEMPHLHDAMPDPFAQLRTTIRPGCTGLWQISERCIGMIHEHPEFDEYYVRNHTLRLDVWILARTVMLVGFGSRLITMASVPSWTMPTDGLAADSDEPVVLPPDPQPAGHPPTVRV